MGQLKPSSCARLGFCGDVVPREHFGALMSIESAYAALDEDRDAVLAAAREEAAGVVAEAAARTEEMIAAARSEYDAAAERGYRDGYDQAFGKWLDRLADVADVQNQLQLRMRERLADIVASAVEQIVRAESRETLFERAFASVERIVDGATYLRVVVHENDFEQATAIFATFEARWREFGRPIAMSVVADKRLAPGSCLCESDFGAVDASLDTQLRAMRGAVARALKRSMEEARADDVDTMHGDGSIDTTPDRDEGYERHETGQSAAGTDASRGART
ncbi:type III secretion system stator protein SctL [Burkholderia sp. NLJ2]|uniref:type III secretion system stator protein SctL n=1 Tax=Burkholderia sp. NLJ2 TaxID=3090699 RepID=UPI003C6CAE55